MIDHARPRRHGTPTDPATLGRDHLQRSEDREDAIRAARRASPARPSTSHVEPRCATCGQWPRRDELGRCRGDGGLGHPYTPVETQGLAVVR